MMTVAQTCTFIGKIEDRRKVYREEESHCSCFCRCFWCHYFTSTAQHACEIQENFSEKRKKKTSIRGFGKLINSDGFNVKTVDS